MHYYPHHIGDFIRDTARLSDSQTMAYLRLMWAYYDKEQPLENSPKKLAFQVGSTPEDIELILEHFFVLDEDVWRHRRCDAEISEFHGKKEKAAASANARWKRAKDMRTHNERNANEHKNDANQEPRTKNQEPNLKEDNADTPQAPAKASRKPSTANRPDSVDQQVWQDFLTMRKVKDAPVTETALRRLESEAKKAGMSTQQAMETCCAQGWRGFKAEWVQNHQRGTNHAARLTQQKSFAQQERERGWLRWEEMTGREHEEMRKIRQAEGLAYQGNVIDVEPTQQLLEGGF